jgi:hypothetical protein
VKSKLKDKNNPTSGYGKINSGNHVPGSTSTYPMQQSRMSQSPKQGYSDAIAFRFYGRSVYRKSDPSYPDNKEKNEPWEWENLPTIG